ncbi:MAG: AraC family transcriptional regulator [Lachnospiraceae bacterium]|nr:AraC family transcriptional regulator [Lachnospiraceae bacterium]
MYKVFLVDDDRIILDELKERVPWPENGFEVAGADTDPVRALQRIGELLPDVVFCDLKMPGMDGNELISRIRSGGVPCEFVMLSAYDDYRDVRTFFKQSGYDYLLKPIQEDELRLLLEKLYRKISMEHPDSDLSAVSDNPAFNSLVAYVDEHYTDRLSLAQISDRFGFSRNYVCQLFRKHFNKTFSIYLTDKRMAHARELLKQRGISVKEAAALSGYGDYYHFYKTFKSYFGCAPREYRS